MSRDFQELKMRATTILRATTPYRRGGLRGSIKTKNNVKGFTVSIGGRDAPYVRFVNEPWKSPQWNGRQNPREGFIDTAAELMAQNIEQTMGVRRVR